MVVCRQAYESVSAAPSRAAIALAVALAGCSARHLPGSAAADGGAGSGGTAGAPPDAGPRADVPTTMDARPDSPLTTGGAGSCAAACGGAAGTTQGSGGAAGTTTGNGGGAAGTSTGGGGAAGTSAGGGRGGGAGGGSDIAAPLDGQKWLVPCTNYTRTFTILTCQDTSPNGCGNRDDTVTFGGEAGKVYDVTVRIRGVVEPKKYSSGTKDPYHEGFYVGGTPSSSLYNVYMVGVSEPQQSYYLNAVDHTEAHFAYPIDYTVTIPIAGGAAVRLYASDPDCYPIRNCDPTSVDGPASTGTCYPLVLPDLPAAEIQQPSTGQFVVMHVVSVAERSGGTGGASGAPVGLSIAPASLVTGPGISSVGTATTLHARLVNTDGSVSDLTSAATWTSSDRTVADVGANGAIATFAGGITTITASAAGMSATTTVQVIAPKLSSIAIYPPFRPSDVSVELAVGATMTLSGSAIMDDGRKGGLPTAVAQWSSSNPAAVAVAGNGVTGVAAGESVITAAMGSISGSLRVKAANLQSIAISPPSLTLQCPSYTNFKAMGSFSDGVVADVTYDATWMADSDGFTFSSLPPGSVSPRCAAGDIGPHTITATLAGVSGTATLTLTAAP